jgi:hypothetical protein
MASSSSGLMAHPTPVAASQSVVLVVRAGLPNCCVVIYLGAGPGGIFLGKPEKTAAQVQIWADFVAKVPKCRATNFPQNDKTSGNRRSM